MANSNPRSNLRCHHCAFPLSKEMETSEWTVAPLVRNSFSMIGSAVGGTTSAFYGFSHVMPIVRRCVKGPMWVLSSLVSLKCYSSPLFCSSLNCSLFELVNRLAYGCSCWFITHLPTPHSMNIIYAELVDNMQQMCTIVKVAYIVKVGSKLVNWLVANLDDGGGGGSPSRWLVAAFVKDHAQVRHLH
ncbi:hypothetical protein CRYUN_Cryun05aG0037800 [Craigia yunnanensis]